MLSNWRNPPRPVAKSAEQGNRITGDTGKSVDDERDSPGIHRPFRIVELMLLVAILIGLTVSTANPAGIIAALMLLPAVVLRQPFRRRCYSAATSYYAGALWPLAVGAKNFFGADVSILGAIAFWAVCALLLALPYPVLWAAATRQLFLDGAISPARMNDCNAPGLSRM
jgi:hypothetical protein